MFKRTYSGETRRRKRGERERRKGEEGKRCTEVTQKVGTYIS